MTTAKPAASSVPISLQRAKPFFVGEAVEARLRGKHHWYPATVTKIDFEAIEDCDWRFTITYSDGFRDLHYPPPPPPLIERNVEPCYMRSLSEHAALTNLYDDCGGDGIGKRGWKRRTGWDRKAVATMPREARPFYEDIDNWEGVSVTNGGLTHLTLDANRLKGILPKSIWKIEHLIELNLSCNSLCGEIPPAVSKLKSIEWMDLSGNKLSGRIPRAIGGCCRLKVLNLSRNEFTGPVPTSLARCLELEECHLAENKLAGDIPLSFVESLKFCEYLSIFDISQNDGLDGAERLRDALRVHLPFCTIFVGSPYLTASYAIQSFGAKAERPPTPTILEPLDEDKWEDEFLPPWIEEIE